MPETFIGLIAKKRDREELSGQEIGRLVSAITKGEAAPYQVSAFLMAAYLNGLSERETVDLTLAMVNSGETVDLSSIDGFKADKHSTGGVGDKVTLILGPLVAAAGVRFPKLSGRGLAHTGGTLDKLESVPGMRVNLTLDEFRAQVQEIGLAVTGQTKRLVPADGIIYGIRDQTGTVASIPLIASSVMSKKLASGADGIVLDVKCGRGAFMKTVEQAKRLARQMVDIGHAAGKQTRALVTSMDIPLGFAVGNALEVREAIETLRGDGPDDLKDEVLALGVEILLMAAIAQSRDDARERLEVLLENGSALEKLRQMIHAQGGDSSVVDEPDLLPKAARVEIVGSLATGFVRGIDALAIGEIAMHLGAGRRSPEERVSASAGVVLMAKPGAAGGKVDRRDPLCALHIPGEWSERVPLDALKAQAIDAFTIGPEPADIPPSVLATIEKGNS